MGFLERRGLADETAIKHFRLGFVDRTLGLRLPKRNTVPGRQLRDQPCSGSASTVPRATSTSEAVSLFL